MRLGARRLVVISPRALPGEHEDDPVGVAREHAVAKPAYVMGKALDALLLDHVDADLERLEQVNAVLRAGRRRWGPGFEAELAAAMDDQQDLHLVETTVIRPSVDLGALAAAYVRSPAFTRRACRGARRLVRALAALEGSVETDLVSYLLFDGAHAGYLMELGKADARAQAETLGTSLAPRGIGGRHVA
jgi:NTE family protein